MGRLILLMVLHIGLRRQKRVVGDMEILYLNCHNFQQFGGNAVRTRGLNGFKVI